MTTRLTPEQLGAVGESRFAHLCELAQLICNKSIRDVTGWDFVVELPLNAPGKNDTLDKRCVRSCVVQLKSTADDGGRISVHLSAIERLAKDPRPALLIVLRLRPNGEDVAGHIVHLLDGELARILERLRRSHARNSFKINRATISFDYKKVGTRFDLSAEGLAAAISTVLREEPSAYLREKQRQLEQLGYENGYVQAEAVFRIEDDAHLANVLLGLAPIRPAKIRAFDARFGIRVPYTAPWIDEIEEIIVDPPRMGPCEIAIRGSGLTQAAIFSAEMHVAPPVGGPDSPIMAARHPDFVLKISRVGMRLETITSIDDVPRPLERWAELLRGLSHVASRKGKLTVTGPGSFGPITLPLTEPLDGPYIEELPKMSAFLDGWRRLLGLAGVTSSEPFLLDEIWNASEAAGVLDMMFNPQPVAIFEIAIEDYPHDATVDALYFNTCRFADTAVTFCIKVTFGQVSDDRFNYRSERFDLLDIGSEAEDLNAYGEDQANKTDIRILLRPENILKRSI